MIRISYLIDKFKGKYRILSEIDQSTNDFTRKLNGSYEDIDCYIACQNNIRVYYYGNKTLMVYIPSVGRGNNIIKAIQEINSELIFDIVRTDAEVEFKFLYSNSDTIIPLLKPKTNGAGISPFSSRNLYKSDYKIPDEELSAYKSIIANVPSERVLSITHITTSFLKSLVSRKRTWEDVRKDMKLKGLKGKEYIHSVGRGDEYLKFLKEKLDDEKN